MDIVKKDRFSMARGFAQSNVSGDNRLKNLIFEVAPHLLGHLVGEVVSAVEHGEQDSFEL
jgi:hypothetical protein